MENRVKRHLILLLTFMFMSQVSAYGQTRVHDKQKEKQFRSMEAGGWDFEPGWYYYFLHKNYSGAEKYWKWAGFKSGYRIRFKESKSNVKRIMPVRTSAELTQAEKVKKVNTEEQKVKELHEEELYRAADRQVDLMYSSFKEDFNKMQDNISDGLAYCMAKSKGKLAYQVKELSDANEVLCEGIAYIHKQGIGYELENSKRQKAYIEFKKKMEKLVERTFNLMLMAQTHY